jgi:hypothetical protein
MIFASYLRYHRIDLHALPTSVFLHLLDSAAEKRAIVRGAPRSLDLSLAELVAARRIAHLPE